MAPGQRLSGPLATFMVFNAIVFISASCTIIGKNFFLNIDKPTGCEYTTTWSITFAKAALAISIIGMGNMVTSWKSQSIRKLYSYLVTALGVCLCMMIAAVFLFVCYKPLENGLKFGVLARQFTNQESWGEIRECLVQNDICNGLVPTPSSLALPDINPDQRMIQYGCCRPPVHCSFLFINGTYWALPVKDKDCQTWFKNAGKPSLDSDFCKRGFLMSVLDFWARIFGTCLIWLACFGVCLFCEYILLEDIQQQHTIKVVEHLETDLAELEEAKRT